MPFSPAVELYANCMELRSKPQFPQMVLVFPVANAPAMRNRLVVVVKDPKASLLLVVINAQIGV